MEAALDADRLQREFEAIFGPKQAGERGDLRVTDHGHMSSLGDGIDARWRRLQPALRETAWTAL